MNVSNYVKGGFPYLFFETYELRRAVANIHVDESIAKYRWNMVEGLIKIIPSEIDDEPKEIICKFDRPEPEHGEYDLTQIEDLLEVVPMLGQRVIVLAELFDVYLEDATVIQKFLNMTHLLKHNQIAFSVVSTDRNKIPSPLEKLFTVIDFPLPSKEEFRKFLKEQCEAATEKLGKTVEYVESVADACVGLAMEEGESILVKMLLDCESCNMEALIESKKEVYAKTGFMHLDVPTKRENFGGYEEAIDNFIRRKSAWEPESIKPKMRAIIAVGIPGCGKSELAKMLGSIFGIPILSVDLGTASGGLVGESERKIRQVTKIIDASGFVIALFDEFEKSLGGSGGRSSDGGVSDDRLGHLLKWLQDRTSEAIVFATVNDISRLPSEILRAGRWDEMYFFGFPNFSERRQILEIMNRKWKAEVPVSDENLQKLEKFTGAEIQEVVKKSHFYDNFDEILGKVPRLWNSKRSEMEELLKFASQMQNASRPDPVKPKVALSGTGKRTLDIGSEVNAIDDLKKTIKEKML